jgi:hypothetical protein
VQLVAGVSSTVQELGAAQCQDLIRGLNAQPLLGPSVAFAVDQGIACLDKWWLSIFAQLVETMAGPATARNVHLVLHPDGALLNVLVEVLDNQLAATVPHAALVLECAPTVPSTGFNLHDAFPRSHRTSSRVQ